MLALLLLFLGGALAVVVAGVFLTRYADTIGRRSGLGGTLAGAVLLATATSLPELAVDSNLASRGQADLVLGDLLGSSLFNLLILGVLDLSMRSSTRILAGTAAAHALSSTMGIALTAIVLLFLVAPFDVTFFGVGPGPILVAISYVVGLRLVYYDQQHAMGRLAPGEISAGDVHAISLGHAWAGFVASSVVILMAAPVLATAAEGLAEASGLGGTFVGTTLVAMSTSMPEAVTTWAAVRSGAFDLAVGNVFGSNAFNMVILLPADFFFEGSILSAASPTHAVTAVCVIFTTAVATTGLLYRPERRFWLIEPDAALVVLSVLSSLGLVYYLR